MVAIAKPAGLLVHRTRLAPGAGRFAIQRLRDQLARRVYPAHRLDRATSGVLLFALSPDVHARLSQAFAAGEVEKRYVAIVRGWPPEELVIDHPLGRLEAPAPVAAESLRPARTILRRLATAELPVRVDRYPTSRYALVELRPASGRRHQLRRHLKHANYPIIGDTTYGQGRHNRLFRERFGASRLLLAAVSLRLAHPMTGAALAIEAPPGADFLAVATAVGWPEAAALVLGP